MHITNPSASKAATASNKITPVGIGLVIGIGKISKIASQEIQSPFKRQIYLLSVNFEKRGRTIFSSTLVTLLRFCRSCCANQRGNLKSAIFFGSQGDRLPNAICTDKIKQAVPGTPVKPGGMGNKNGKTSKAMTKLNPRSEVSAKISPKESGFSANLCSNDLIS